MLKLTNIKKDYVTGDTTVNALKGVSLEFRKSEFVSILGQSGCGKTTLLNIIGGLDKYTSGDLVINGVSTKKYDDSDWDTYRNHSIGFVFQNYNLIPHQTVIANVELALTLSGVPKAERRRRATEALCRVGLGDQINKKPNQLSGGQMQRVAIARALVNNPDILLADEPTGALDSETSVQIMEILKEISKDKLIIMVTHNPELADEYSTRIIRLLDGLVVADSNPYSSKCDELVQNEIDVHVASFTPSTDGKTVSLEDGAVETHKEVKAVAKPKDKKPKEKKKKSSMSFFTALSLSFKNLLTKKGRTFLTAFAGSIGIIGIALILSVSAGVNAYIKSVEESTMSSYPIEIHESTMDTMSLLSSFMEQSEIENKQPNTVYSNDVMLKVMDAFTKGITKNNLSAFKAYIASSSTIKNNAVDIKYQYTAGFNTYTKIESVDGEGNVIYYYRKNLSDMSDLMSVVTSGSSTSVSSVSSSTSLISSSVWKEFVGNIDYIKTQYEIVDGGGRFPENENEVVLIVGSDLTISDYVLYMLGIRDSQEIRTYLMSTLDDDPTNDIVIEPTNYTFDDILNYEFKVLADSDKYKVENDKIVDCSTSEIDAKLASEDAITLKIVGIVTPSGDSMVSASVGSIGYIGSIMDKMISRANESEVVALQMANTEKNLYNGFPLAGFTVDFTTIRAMINSNPQLSAFSNFVKTDDQFIDTLKTYLGPELEALLLPYGEIGSTVPYGGYTLADIMLITDALGSVEGEIPSALAKLICMEVAMNPTNLTKAQNLVNIINSLIDTEDHNGILAKFGYVNKENPTKILIYPKDFEAKDIISAEIDAYNDGLENTEDRITYSDMVGVLMNSVTTIVNAISYVLVAFVAISLVVSSIMIGIITYISVLERTKEIGILRAVGASKKDVSRVFNAETLIVGFAAGVIGIGVSLLLIIVINVILQALTGLENLKAVLPFGAAVILVLISMGLTLIAGIIPAGIAAKKDPVIALRSE